MRWVLLLLAGVAMAGDAPYTPAQAETFAGATRTRTRVGSVRYLDPVLQQAGGVAWLFDQLDLDHPADIRRGYAEALTRLLADAPPGDDHLRWVARVTKEQDPLVAGTLIDGLGHADGQTAAAGLTAALRRPEADLRRLAALTASFAPPSDTLTAALVAAALDPSPAVRAEAARALGVLGAADGLAAFARDPDPAVQAAVARAQLRIHRRLSQP